MLLKHREINKKNLLKIKKNIQQHTKIMAVTKTLSIKAIDSAIKNNILLIGENKIQETEQKIKNYKNRKKIKLHLIGHLQSNKVKKAVALYDTIETVDSEKILVKINKEAEKIRKKQNIYLQINIGEDKKKFGFSEKETIKIYNKNKNKKHINITGLMTILPNGLKTKKQKELYDKMKKIQKNIYIKKEQKITNLSMGMSQDYIIASQSGSTQIRIGTFLYGER